MKYVFTPVRDTDNTDPPEVEFTIFDDPNYDIYIELKDPHREFRIKRSDWETLCRATRQT